MWEGGGQSRDEFKCGRENESEKESEQNKPKKESEKKERQLAAVSHKPRERERERNRKRESEIVRLFSFFAISACALVETCGDFMQKTNTRSQIPERH